MPLEDPNPAPNSSVATITDRARRVANFKPSGAIGAQVTEAPISVFKVFSATKARDREELGERVSAWIEANPQIEVRKTVVSLSSDASFHCLSFVLICAQRAARA